MPETYTQMSEAELVGRLAKLAPTSAKAALAHAALTDDDWFSAVSELRRRFSRRSVDQLTAREEGVTGRMRSATTCEIDGARWKTYWFSMRMRLSDVGRLVGLCPNWASVIACKQRVSYHTLDRIACALEMSTDDLLWAVASDRERERVGLLK